VSHQDFPEITGICSVYGEEDAETTPKNETKKRRHQKKKGSSVVTPMVMITTTKRFHGAGDTKSGEKNGSKP
jgi:hypothetical protein